jgi:hypothetical protein
VEAQPEISKAIPPSAIGRNRVAILFFIFSFWWCTGFHLNLAAGAGW